MESHETQLSLMPGVFAWITLSLATIKGKKNLTSRKSFLLQIQLLLSFGAEDQRDLSSMPRATQWVILALTDSDVGTVYNM